MGLRVLYVRFICTRWLGVAEEGQPCGLLEEISMSRRRIDQTPVNSDPVEPQTRYSSIPLAYPSSCFVFLSFFPLFQDSVRAYNYRRHASPRTLLERASTESSLPLHPQSIPRLLRTALRFFYSSPSSSLILGRSLDLYRGLAGLLHPSSTPCWRGHTVPHYHTIFMLAPPGPKSRTTAHYTSPNPSCNA